ncbi:MAG: hypothetical protein AB2L07_17340 [Thermoanaerobaculaceae bacterium]
MLVMRVCAGSSAVAFAVLAAVLAATDLISSPEALAAALAVAAAFLPSAWLAPAGFRRRAAELALLPPAFALALLADPAQRALALPPLLLLAALAATLAARSRLDSRSLPLLATAFALALVAAASPGLAGFPAWRAVLALLLPPLLAWVVASRLGFDAALLVALLSAPLPWVRWPLAAALALLLAAAVALSPRLRPSSFDLRHGWGARVARGWLGGALAVALLTSALAPWGLLPPHLAFPHATWLAAPLSLAALLLTPLLPPAAAGAAWLAVVLSLGPPQPPPAERPALSLTPTSPSAQLPPGSGQPYVLDLALANAAALPAGTVVGTLTIGDRSLPLHTGAELAEWAILRPGSRPAHGLPDRPVFRPRDAGAAAFWSVGNRLLLDVPPGVIPALARTPSLGDTVVLLVAQAGPARPTPPRSWPLPAWLLATALAVAALQLAARTFTTPFASLPWALLAAGALAARLPVEPLRLLAERHAPDLALAALLAAWLPLARRFLASHPFLSATALLLPLALATPQLGNPVGDGNYHFLLLQSLTRDGDFDLSDNYDLARYPNQGIYVPFGGTFLHSPVLAVLLAPGFALAGRGGALAVLALAGAGLVWLLARRARELGVPASRIGWMVLGVLLSYPLVTFACELWTELPGALLAAATLGLVPAGGAARWLVPCLALLGAGIKTRFALSLGPQVLAAWWPRRVRVRSVLLAALVLAATGAVAALAFSALVGNPLDPLGRRSLLAMLRIDPRQAVLTLGGLVFDSASGMLWAAPLGLASLFALPSLWRRGGPGERALLFGAALTVGALLHLQEWRGGDSPPFRYLVPLLPLAALAGAMLLGSPRRWRPLLWLAVPPTLVVSWVAATRPGVLLNSGSGGWWLGNALARRTGADALDLFPSFLRLAPATWLVPVVLVLVVAAVAVWTRQAPGSARWLRTGGMAVWVVAGAAVLAVLAARPDTVVELEDPQVRRRGGQLDPPPGTFMRYLVPNGWRLADGEAVEVPLRLAPRAMPRLALAVDGPGLAELSVRWGGGADQTVRVQGPARAQVDLAPPAAPGRVMLSLGVAAPFGTTVVLDRLLLEPDQ